jgi:hypothetical protein
MRARFTYANVTATLALFLALTGAGAYAAGQLAPRSVGEPQLRPGAVTADKIRKSAVTAPKIKAEAIKRGKLADRSVTAAKMGPAAITSGSLAEGAVTGEKIGPEAVSGDNVVESTLSQVPSAARADVATSADSGNPPAFAYITAEATIDADLSKGIAQVRDGSLAGIYCVAAQGFNPRGAQVTPRLTVSGSVTAYAKVGGSADCPAPQVEVQTFDAGTRTRAPFFLALYR